MNNYKLLSSNDFENSEKYNEYIDMMICVKNYYYKKGFDISNVPDINTNNSSVLGDIYTIGFGIDIENFANTNSKFFLHTALSNPHGNGNIDDYQIVNKKEGTTEDGYIGFSEANYAKGEMLKENGYSVYLGAKYEVDTTLKFGLEYNYGSKYWFSATQGAEDILNKLATRGWVTEAYTIWKYHPNLFVKFGYVSSKENYTGSGWHGAEPAKKDATQKVGYINLNAKF